MKRKLTLICLSTVFIFICSITSYAQDDKASTEINEQLIVVHVDEVNPAMTEKYNSLAKQFVNECTKHNIDNVTLWTSRTEDNQYYWASPIKNMAELDTKWYTPLMEKMGKEAFTKMFDAMDYCYDKHYSIIMKSNPKISMMPKNPAEINDNTYRKFTWYYFKPVNADKAQALAGEFKQLYTEAGIDFYNYVIHEPVFAESGNSFVVMHYAKDKASYDKIQAMVDQKVGEKRKELFNKLEAITLKKEVKEAEYLPGLSYEPRKLLKVK